ncbi:MAG TPA: SBBP repeat-containing protein, partial [Bacteroidia bacterium]
ITGYFDSIITFDSTRLYSAGGTDVYIAKYDPDGILLWAKQIGGRNDDYSSGISTDITGNCYITGYFYIQGTTNSFGSTSMTEAGDADMFISKFSADGNLIWVRNGGGRGQDASFGIATDANGNSYICGYFTGTAVFGNFKVTSAGYSDIFVSKYDAGGNLIWIKTCGGAYQDEAYAIATDIAGNCYVTGYFTGNVNFGGTNLTSAGFFDTDVFFLKFNPSGNLTMAKRAGGNGNDIGYGIDVDKKGNIFIAGIFHGENFLENTIRQKSNESNGFLAKFEGSGKLSWSKTISGNSSSELRKIHTDAAGNSFVTGIIKGNVQLGSLSLTSAGGKDGILAKYDSDGNLAWANLIGGVEEDEGISLFVNPAGICYTAGQYTGEVTIAKSRFSGWGGLDIFLSRIK